MIQNIPERTRSIIESRFLHDVVPVIDPDKYGTNDERNDKQADAYAASLPAGFSRLCIHDVIFTINQINE